MLKTREHKLLAIVAACICLLAADRLLFSPIYRSWSRDHNEILELRGKLARDQAQVEQQAQWQTRMNEIHERKLPDDLSAAESRVVSEVNACAERSGLDITSVRPLWEGNGGKTLHTIRLRMNGKGDLAAIQSFAMAVETSKLPLYVRYLEIRNSDDRGTRLEIDTEISAVLVSTKKEDT